MAKSASKQKQNKQRTAKLALFILVAIILVAVIVFGIFAIAKIARDKEGKKDNAQNINTASEILRTEDDLKDEDKVAQAGNESKDRMEADERNKPTVEQNAAGLNIATPVVNFVGMSEDKSSIEAGGAITNINELEGNCTFVFTNGDTTVTASSGILPGPSYITCEAVKVDRSKFTNGTWNVKIQYKSNRSEGESDTQSFEIQ